MNLRPGKTKNILHGSIDAALLAVEVYNKPRATFRSQAYIVLMIIAWTRLFHAYFNKRIGNKYYYKNNRGRYIQKNGERKAWELNTCINEFEKYRELSEPVKANLRFFVSLRNMIAHRNIAERELDTSIFGECQSLLYNYENLLREVFGSKYAINESLTFSLQFSYMRTREQEQANKKLMSAEVREIKSYIENYRSNLRQEDFDSQEYSIKLIQIPKISNTNRNDLAVEFVRWSELDPSDKDTYQHIASIIKDRRVVVEAKNVDTMLPSKVVEKVKQTGLQNFSVYDHTCLYTVFSIRPPKKATTPDSTNTVYCIYDAVHKDYSYKESWVAFIVKLFEKHGLTINQIRRAYNECKKWNIDKYS